MAFIREPNQEKYCQFLIDTFPTINYPLKSLNLSGIFYKPSLHEHLFKFDLSSIKNSIIELDLSFCNLTDDEVSKILTITGFKEKIEKIRLSEEAEK